MEKNFLNLRDLDKELYEKFLSLHRKNHFTEIQIYIKVMEELGEVAKELLRREENTPALIEELLDTKIVLDDLLLRVLKSRKISNEDYRALLRTKLAKWESHVKKSEDDKNHKQLSSSSDIIDNIIPNETIEIIEGKNE